MERQNITLSLPKELLLKIKHIAIDKNTSISGLLTETLEEIVRRDASYSEAKQRQISLMAKGFAMGSTEPGLWNRENLHDRN
jgi:hypothetical protein